MSDFNIVYQKKINSGYIVSVEALLRPINCSNVEEYVKNHPNPIDLDIQVIHKVLEEIITFNIPVMVSINVCYHSFVNDDFIDFCLTTLPSFNVQLELTEYNKITDIKKLQANIERLNNVHIPISLDDYGKNFATMNLITEIAFSQIKIDKSLIDCIETNFSKYKHLSFITEKIKEFGITDIIYEGVEKEEQVELIKIFNSSPTIQGYLYSKPLPIKAIAFEKTLNQTQKKNPDSHEEHLEKLVYDLVVSRNNHLVNDKIIECDLFNNIFNSDPEKSISNFRNLYYNKENKLTINSIFSVISNNTRMMVIRNSQGVVIFENKKHEAFFGQSIVGMSLEKVLSIFPDYKNCIYDDSLLINSNNNYSMEKEFFFNINYFTIRQKVNFNNETFIFTTVYEESEGAFSNKDNSKGCPT